MQPIHEKTGLRREQLIEDFHAIRGISTDIAKGLTPEDQTVQSMPDCSPTKWHLAHVSWFYETFLLVPHLDGYEIAHPQFPYLFNSYYEAAGERYPRFDRGLITRPGADDVRAYRGYVEENMQRLFARADERLWSEIAPIVAIGNHHEQQHQELMLMDILNLFSRNPLCPAFRPYRPSVARETEPLRWHCFPGGISKIGHDGDGFCYDNENPRHEVLLRPYRLASRLVTNGEWVDFIEDGGYARADLWLSDGWARAKTGEFSAPLYWDKTSGDYEAMTLNGRHRIDPAAPVCHVSYFEADAFARWSGKRLPTEAEWEVAAQSLDTAGNFMEGGYFRALAATGGGDGDAPQQMFGDVWEWTQSPYSPYPGYRPEPGALGEYNGKFMASQFVLRGGSFGTPQRHIRASYRNFFYPHQRWPFAGLRLAEDA